MKTLRWLLPGVLLLALVPLAANGGWHWDDKDENSLRSEAVPVVLDSTGKIVGRVIDTNFLLLGGGGTASSGAPTLALNTGRLTVFVGAYTDHLIGSMGQLFFTTPDCTDTAYVPYFPNGYARGGTNNLISSSYVKNDGTLYAAPGSSSAPLTITVNSQFSTISPPDPDVCFGASGEITAVEANRVANLSAMFTPPFVLH